MVLYSNKKPYVSVHLHHLKDLKDLNIIKKIKRKIALGFRYAQTLLNLAFARFIGAIFVAYFRDFEKKQKQDQKRLGIRFAHQLFARSARSRLNSLHVIFTLLGFTA